MAEHMLVGLPRDVPTQGLWRGSDLTTVRRVCGSTWAVGAAMALPFSLLLAPGDGGPVVVVGAVAWLVLTLVGAVMCLGGSSRAGFVSVLAIAWAELAVLTALQTASGGWATPYWQLLGIHAVVVAACFPARAAVPFVAMTLLCSLSPLVTGDTAGRTLDVLVHAATWLGLCVIGLGAMRRVRARRLELAHSARHDELTELGNRRALSDEITEALVPGRLAIFGLGDVDDFKRVNDEFGHLVGDACLRDASAALRRATADVGRTYRWAGDEFAVMLWAPSEEGLAARRTHVEQVVRVASRRPDGEPVSMTFGWTTVECGEALDEVIDRADLAMLARKRVRADDLAVPFGSVDGHHVPDVRATARPPGT